MLTRRLKLCMKTVGNAYGVHMLPPPHTHITMCHGQADSLAKKLSSTAQTGALSAQHLALTGAA